jgi:uncharacterized protein (TIGR04562 family)
MPQLTVRNRADAESLLASYGYDWQDPTQKAELVRFLEEAIHFIENRFLTPDWQDGCPDRIPAPVRSQRDVLELLLSASTPTPDRPWACAVLKVMHGLVHIHHHPTLPFTPVARERILSQFRAVIGSDNMLGDLPLVAYQEKSLKSRDSLLLKILCKKETVADDIRDLMGVRLVTETAEDTLTALELLLKARLIVAPNIIPSRSRNTLIDWAYWQQHATVLPPALAFSDHNPNSSESYRSIHITARQLIRFGGVSLFFPYEIQLLDRANYLESMVGDSAHQAYKRRKLTAARRRVLAGVLSEAP